jgi:hypothetical protein
LAGQTIVHIMRLWILAVAITAAGTATAWAGESAPLATLHAVHGLTKAEARGGLPVAFEATVTYYNRSDVDLFVQEDGEAIYVETKPNEDMRPGDRVLVRGRTRDSFTPDLVSDSVTVLRHGAPPKPIAAGFEELIRAQRDCMRVSVRATVRSADTVNFGNMHGIYLKLLMERGTIDTTVAETDASRLKELLDAEVEVTGVVSGKLDPAGVDLGFGHPVVHRLFDPAGHGHGPNVTTLANKIHNRPMSLSDLHVLHSQGR